MGADKEVSTNKNVNSDTANKGNYQSEKKMDPNNYDLEANKSKQDVSSPSSKTFKDPLVKDSQFEPKKDVDGPDHYADSKKNESLDQKRM